MVRPRDGRSTPAHKNKEARRAEGPTGTEENQARRVEGPTGTKQTND